jgi:glycosyltransferase involved in cell wall biosynthesis
LFAFERIAHAAAHMSHIVIDNEIFSMQPFGGISRYFCETASRINSTPGWSVTVVAPLHKNEHLLASGIPTIGWYSKWWRGPLADLARCANAAITPHLLARANPQLIHRTYYSAARLSYSVPDVITIHDMIPERFPQLFPSSELARSKRLAVNSTDHVICVSKSTATDLMQYIDLPPGKISVIHHGLSRLGDWAATNKGIKTHDRPYILYVGLRSVYKNFQGLVRAYAASPRLMRDFDIIAFGGSDFAQQERAFFHEMRIRTDSIHHRSGGDRSLASYYSGARLFVYPSKYEGFGMPPLEAMDCECPVACSDTSSLPEIVGSAGRYFDPNNIHSIRAAVEAVAYDERVRDELIAKGKLRSREFSWDRSAAETRNVYSQLLD